MLPVTKKRMSLVKNKNGAQVCFEIAEAYMRVDLWEHLKKFRFPTKQAFFSAYEVLYEKEFGEPCRMSECDPIYA